MKTNVLVERIRFENKRAVALEARYDDGAELVINARSVVDTQLRVRGVENLRVADCSVMPALVSGNTNAPTMMIADRCADFILGVDVGAE